eukprot:359025-Chlamydomonas_euryale.AAC.1
MRPGQAGSTTHTQTPCPHKYWCGDVQGVRRREGMRPGQAGSATHKQRPCPHKYWCGDVQGVRRREGMRPSHAGSTTHTQTPCPHKYESLAGYRHTHTWPTRPTHTQPPARIDVAYHDCPTKGPAHAHVCASDHPPHFFRCCPEF